MNNCRNGSGSRSATGSFDVPLADQGFGYSEIWLRLGPDYQRQALGNLFGGAQRQTCPHKTVIRSAAGWVSLSSTGIETQTAFRFPPRLDYRRPRSLPSLPAACRLVGPDQLGRVGQACVEAVRQSRGGRRGAEVVVGYQHLLLPTAKQLRKIEGAGLAEFDWPVSRPRRQLRSRPKARQNGRWINPGGDLAERIAAVVWARSRLKCPCICAPPRSWSPAASR